MSRSNILSITPLPSDAGVVVTFRVHQGTLSYLYTDPDDARAIINGADPADFNGTKLQGSSGGQFFGGSI